MSDVAITVKELKALLEKYKDTDLVRLSCGTSGGFGFGTLYISNDEILSCSE